MEITLTREQIELIIGIIEENLYCDLPDDQNLKYRKLLKDINNQIF